MTTGTNFMDQIASLLQHLVLRVSPQLTNVTNTGNWEDWLPAGQRPRFLILQAPHFIHKVERATLDSKGGCGHRELKWQI